MAVSNGVDGSSPSSAGGARCSSNFVKDNFVGIEVMRTKCLECESSTYKKEEFTNIGVPIMCVDDDDADEGASQNYFVSRILASETLRDVNKYLCSECSRLNEAQHTVSYDVLPNILVLQLKRFTTAASRVHASKLTDYIPTPLALDCFCQKCRDGDGPRHKYRLYSVILHLGASLASGHYIACVRAADINGDYHQCDRPGSTDAVLRGKQPKRGLFKMFSKSSSAPPEPATVNGAGSQVCASLSCCGLKLNANLVEDKTTGGGGPAPPVPPASSSSINGEFF